MLNYHKALTISQYEGRFLIITLSSILYSLGPNTYTFILLGKCALPFMLGPDGFRNGASYCYLNEGQTDMSFTKTKAIW